MPANPVFQIEQDYDRNIAPIVDDADPDQDEQDDVDTSDIAMQPDGSAVIDLDGEAPAESGFYDNLAETLDETDLRRIATDLLDLIEKDKEARSRRDEQYAEGIKRTGLGNEAPGGADFTGSSRVVHPILTEGCIDFAARTMKEIFPASGPCKTHIIGKADESKLDKAERKKSYMNWQLTKQIKEYRSELEQMLTQLPMGGSQYMKIWYDNRVERPCSEFVPIDDIFLPFSVSDFYSSHRTTHQQRITRNVFHSRIKSGLYRDINAQDASLLTDTSAAKQASDKIEGVEDSFYNEDGLRTIYEIYVEHEIDDPLVDEDCDAPYIITVDESTSKVLAIYRNWDENDKAELDGYHEKLDWIVEYKFIPWRGAYGIGLPHIIGSMSGALTGALRALMDSAHINNMPGMLKLKGNRTAGQSISVGPTEITELEAGPNIDDIRKLAMPMPFNPPSPVLFQMLDWMTAQAKGIVGTAEESIANASNDMPMGTALALIEQGSITFSAIHARQHASQAKFLDILHRINRDNISDHETIEELGDLVVSRQDFQGPMDIIPVSDPNIFSEAQRFAQIQAVQQQAEKYPQLFNLDKLNRRTLQLINVPNYEEFLQEAHEPERLDACEENLVASEGKQPLKAYDDQDHLSHMMAHLHYALSPIFCANPMMAVPALPALIAHITKEHLPMFYAENVKAAGGAMAQVTGAQEDDEQAQMQAAAIADKVMAQKLAPVMQMLQQAQQAAQQFIPPPPPDPSTQMQLTLGQAQIASNEKIEGMKLQQKQTEAQVATQIEAMQVHNEAQAASMAANQEAQATAVNQQNELIKNHQDNQTSLMIEKMKIDSERFDQITQHIESPKYTADATFGYIADALQSISASMQETKQRIDEMAASHAAPKRIMKDANGEITGVQHGDKFIPAVRNENNEVIGLGEQQ